VHLHQELSFGGERVHAVLRLRGRRGAADEHHQSTRKCRRSH
jgi:hypothetical protein